MTTRLASITLAAIAVLAPAGAAAAPSDADCSVDAARKYRSKPALARGLPVTVTCDGPATFSWPSGSPGTARTTSTAGPIPALRA